MNLRDGENGVPPWSSGFVCGIAGRCIMRMRITTRISIFNTGTFIPKDADPLATPP